MVTMRWWDDLWLNEGFANTLMYFALDSIYPTWNVVSLAFSVIFCMAFVYYVGLSCAYDISEATR